MKVPVGTLCFLDAVRLISPKGLRVSGRVRPENLHFISSALDTSWDFVFFLKIHSTRAFWFSYGFYLQVVLMALLLTRRAWRWAFFAGLAVYPRASFLFSCPCFWPFLWQVFGRGLSCWHWSLGLPSHYLRSLWITAVERECANMVLIFSFGMKLPTNLLV